MFHQDCVKSYVMAKLYITTLCPVSKVKVKSTMLYKTGGSRYSDDCYSDISKWLMGLGLVLWSGLGFGLGLVPPFQKHFVRMAAVVIAVCTPTREHRVLISLFQSSSP